MYTVESTGKTIINAEIQLVQKYERDLESILNLSTYLKDCSLAVAKYRWKSGAGGK